MSLLNGMWNDLWNRIFISTKYYISGMSYRNKLTDERPFSHANYASKRDNIIGAEFMKEKNVYVCLQVGECCQMDSECCLSFWHSAAWKFKYSH